MHEDVFLNFKDQQGDFIEADTRSLLSLYNAAYLRIHGETLLDKAISFTTRCLQDRLEHLESPLAERKCLQPLIHHFLKGWNFGNEGLYSYLSKGP